MTQDAGHEIRVSELVENQRRAIDMLSLHAGVPHLLSDTVASFQEHSWTPTAYFTALFSQLHVMFAKNEAMSRLLGLHHVILYMEQEMQFSERY